MNVTIASTLSSPCEQAGDAARRGAAGALRSAACALERGERSSAQGLLRGAAEQLGAFLADEELRRGDLHARASEHDSLVAEEMGSLAPEAIVYDAYFGMSRVATLTCSEQACAVMPALHVLALHLDALAMTIDHKCVLARFAAGLLSVPEGIDAESVPREDVDAASQSAVLAPLARWKLGHLLYALANRRAAECIDGALAEFLAHEDARAAELILEAGHHALAITASMELAAAMSRFEYAGEVRPTMCPPSLAIELTGGMNSDHHAYRASLSRLERLMGQSYTELYARSPALAKARDELLEADLADLERHLTLTVRLVGSLPALDESAEQSAAQSLRALYLQRISRYAGLLRRGRTINPGGQR